METIEEHYRNGQLKSRYTINEDGNRHGLFEIWHKNGQLYIRVNYRNGYLHGLFETWNVDGEQTVKQYYIDGKEVTEKGWNEYNKTL